MPDATRLTADAAQALADRSPIDWRALRRRARRPTDRTLIDNLRLVAALRPAVDRDESGGGSLALRTAAVLAATATLQTLLCLALSMSTPLDLTTGGSGQRVALALAFVAAAALLAVRSTRDRRSVFLLAAFATAASPFARTALVEPASAHDWLAVRLAAGWYPEVFTPACLLQFALDFPRVRRFTRFDLIARRVTIAAWVWGGMTLAASVLVDAGLGHANVIAWLHRDDPHQLFWRLFTLGLTLPIAAMLIRARRAPADERRKVARVAVALAAGSAPLILQGLVRSALVDTQTLLPTTIAGRRWFDGVVLGGMMAIPLFTSMAVLIDGAFDRRERRLTRFRLKSRHPGRDLPRALAALRSGRGRREIEARLAEALRDGVGARGARVWTQTTGAIAAMLGSTSPIDLAPDGPLWPLLPAADRDWAAHNDVALAAPLPARDGQVAAVLVVFGRRDGRAYARADRWFVASLAAAVAPLWDAEATAAASPAERAGLEAAFECRSCGLVSNGRALPCCCAAPVVLAALPIIVADKFLVCRRLGRGGMGVVYLARDLALDRDVVLKTLPAPGPGRVDALRREARAMAAIRHEAVAAIHGLELWRETPVLVVEYFPHGTLADRLARRALTPDGAIRLARGLANGLAHMHARGLLHRDVKPANIALTSSGSARLLDFGLASLGAGHATAAGTPAYASPEARRGDAASPADDLWGLAVSTLEALTRNNPFAERRVDWPRVETSLAALDPALPAFFARALSVDPADRFTSAAELERALDTLLTVLRDPRPLV